MKEIANESFNILKRVIILVAIFLIIIIGCIICKYTVMQQIQDIDEAVYLFFKEFMVSEPITKAMKFVTFFGSEYIFIPVIILILIGLKDKRYGMFMAINLIWVYVMNFILKNIFVRPRPISELVPDITGYSFPSSHVMCAIAFYGMLCVLVCTTFKDKLIKRAVIILSSLLIFLISLSRLYLQTHYLSDVLMGLVFGGLCLLIFISIIRAIDNERRNSVERVVK